MTPEYAPRYTGRARVARLALAGLAVTATYALHRLWLLPLVHDLGDHPGCRNVFGVNGVPALFEGLFVGVPLSAAIVLLALQGPTLARSLRTRTYPPPGHRMLGRVRIHRGRPALLLAGAQMLLIAILFVVAWRGTFAAHALLAGSTRPARAPVCGGTAVWPAQATNAQLVTDPASPARAAARSASGCLPSAGPAAGAAARR